MTGNNISMVNSTRVNISSHLPTTQCTTVCQICSKSATDLVQVNTAPNIRYSNFYICVNLLLTFLH